MQASDLRPVEGSTVGQTARWGDAGPAACGDLDLCHDGGVSCGHATIPVGTEVFVGRGQARWAVVHGTEPVAVVMRPGDEWARILLIPGVTGCGQAAYVRASTLR